MTLHSFGDRGGPYSSEWHEKRREAREETFSLDEWDEQDITRFGLDEIPFDRKSKDSTFKLEPEFDDAEGSAQRTDVRDDPGVRD